MPPPGVKKPFSQALPEPALEHSQAETLREWGLKHASQTLAKKSTSLNQLRQTTTEEQMKEINKKVKPDITNIMSPIKWTDTSIKREYLIGDEALYVHPDDHYSLHWPIRQGRFNLYDGPGGTTTAVLQDLETIWSYAIQNFLGIPLKDLKHYRVALLVQDLYTRQQVRDMFSLLLDRIGFSAAFVVQESVCATFGVGVSSACVVDVGDQKTAISCVEDGLSQKKTRLLLEYGGRDITQCFHWLLKRAGFPYKECDLGCRMDAIFMQILKEESTCLDKDTSGSQQKQIQVRPPGKYITNYTFNLGDERLLAPMAMFFPNMFGLIGTKVCRNVDRYRSDPADILDEDYLMQTMSKHEQAARLVALRKKESATVAEQLSQNNDSTMLEDTAMDDDDTMDPPEAEGTSAEAPPAGGIAKLLRKMEEEEEGVDISDGLMGLDEAICRSIERCENDEMKRRMYGCLMVVGGGLLFQGAQDWVAELVWTQIPPHIRSTMETTDIVYQPKDVDPQLTCWKGCAIMCCLDTAQELWIRQGEWKRYGIRVLRERAPFIW